MNSGNGLPDWMPQFIRQNPQLLAFAFPIYFVGFWLLICATVSLLGGWFSLSTRYRTRLPLIGPKWTGQSGQMRLWMNYNNALTLGVNKDGLYLACMFFFRFMHPPLLIPWSEIAVRRSKGLFFEYVTFAIGRELGISLRIRAKLAEQLRAAAGNHWPIEET